MTIFQDVLMRANERTAQRKQEADSRVKLIAPQFTPAPYEKLCSACQEWRPKSAFSPCKRTADKLKGECRACHAASVRKAKRR